MPRFLPGFSFVADLWRHRQLLWQFSVRNIEIRHKGSHLGLIWSFLGPLLMLGLYVVVFGYIFGGKFGVVAHESRAEYALGLFVGLTIFNFFAETIAVAPSMIVGSPNFVKKVVFPLEVLPAAAVGASLFHLLTTLALALIGIATLGPGPMVTWFWLPLILLPVLLLALGLAWFISALGVFWRDVGQITQFSVTALMFASAVFYSKFKIPAAAWFFLKFNPFLHAVELTRNAALWHQAPSFRHLAFLYLSGLASFVVGQTLFRRLRGAFADVL